MTQPVEIPKHVYVANGVITDFGYTFTVLDTDDIKVYIDNVLVSNTEYIINTITLFVEFDTAPLNGKIITIIREIPRNQTSDLGSDPYENAIDRMQRQMQDMQEQLDRAIKGYKQDSWDVEISDPQANHFLRVNSEGTGVEWIPLIAEADFSTETVRFGKIIAGDPGFESSGINIGGVVYEASAKVSDIGGVNQAQFILHRHSTVLPSVIIGARSNSDDDSHAAVVDGQELLSVWAAGYDGADYAMAANIRFEVDGVPGANDMPGRIIFATTPEGAEFPVDHLQIGADGNILVSGTIDGRDVAADGAKLDNITSSSGSSLVGFLPDGTGAVATTSQDKHRERVSIYDFMTANEQTDAKAGTQLNDLSAIMLGAIGELSTFGKGTLILPGGIYAAAGLVYKDFVYLEGEGGLATVIRAPDGANTDVLTMPLEAAGCGLSHLTIDGNKANNTSGHGLVFEGTTGAGGDSFFPYGQKVSGDDIDAYKHFYGHHFYAGAAAGDGIHKAGGAGFQVVLDNFVSSHSAGHGFYNGGSDCIFSNFWLEQNGLSGLNIIGGASKYSNGKAIWNNKLKAGWAGVHVEEIGAVLVSGVSMMNVEAQDNYGDGFFIKCIDSMFDIASNQNGYSAVGAEETSSRVNANFVLHGACDRVSVNGKSFTYKSAVGGDGFWTTEYAYKNLGGNFSYLNISTDGDTNQVSSNAKDTLLNTELADIDVASSDGSTTLYDTNILSQDNLGSVIMRLFRATTTTGNVLWEMYQPNTSTVKNRLNAKASSQFNLDDVGDLSVGSSANGGAWNTAHFVMGPYHLWVDSTGDLRIKSSTPTSDTDGTVVGTQT